MKYRDNPAMSSSCTNGILPLTNWLPNECENILCLPSYHSNLMHAETHPSIHRTSVFRNYTKGQKASTRLRKARISLAQADQSRFTRSIHDYWGVIHRTDDACLFRLPTHWQLKCRIKKKWKKERKFRRSPLSALPNQAIDHPTLQGGRQ